MVLLVWFVLASAVQQVNVHLHWAHRTTTVIAMVVGTGLGAVVVAVIMDLFNRRIKYARKDLENGDQSDRSSSRDRS